MNRSALAFGALLATLAGCGETIIDREDPAYWRYSESISQEHSIALTFYPNNASPELKYQSDTQIAGEFFHQGGQSTPAESATLRALTSTKGLAALGQNYRQGMVEDAELIGKSYAHFSFPEPNCVPSAQKTCAQLSGVLFFEPAQPAVSEFRAFFRDFALRHRGTKAKLASGAAGSTAP